MNALCRSLLLCLFLVQAGYATTVTVTTTTDVVDGNVNSITALNANPGADGKISLREAIIAANKSGGADTILFSSALNGTPIVLTIAGDDNAAAQGDLDINDSVTITGNGANNTIIQGSADANFTSTMGDKIFGINQDGTHTGLIVNISALTIRYGKNNILPSGSFTHTGGGVDIFLTGTGNAITFTDCVITGNQCANGYGGGVNIDSGAPNQGSDHGTVTFTNCTISNNKALETGAGINCFADIHNVVLNNCTITGNITDPGTVNPPGANGGGINVRHTAGGTITGSNATISNNTATGPGGGLCVAAGNNAATSVTFTGTGQIDSNTSKAHPSGSSGTGGGVFKDTTSTLSLPAVDISQNHADQGAAPLGGGVHLLAGTMTVKLGQMGSNTAGNGNAAGNGGGIAVVGGSLDLKFLAIFNNTAAVDGGGLWTGDNGTLTLANCTISGNAAKNNGGGANFKAPSGSVNASLVNVTVANNRADSDGTGGGSGGGIYRGGGTVSLGNTLVAGNVHGTGSTADNGAGTITANYSLFETSSGATLSGANNVVDQPARIGPLADNGGGTLTHMLLGGSPALDAGSAALVPADTLDLNSNGNTTEPLPFDQRGAGFARLLDAGDADTSQQVDIGAVEAHPAVQDIVNQATAEDVPTSLVFNFGDTSLPITNITATSSDTTLVPNSNLVISGAGSSRNLAISAAANKFGTATITVTVSGTENSLPFNSTDTFLLTVSPVADPPGAPGGTTAEDTMSSAGLVITRNPVDGAEVTHFKITGISNGTLFKNDGLTAIGNGTFITVAEGNAGLKFLPGINQNTPAGDSFGFTVQAALGMTDTGISTAVPVSITVNEVNDPPVANNDVLPDILEDSAPLTVMAATLTGNDSKGPANESGQSLSVVSAGSAVGGTVGVVSGNVLFTPTPHYFGAASFQYTVQDNGTTAGAADPQSSTATASFNITHVNHVPVANPDTISRNASEDVKVKGSTLLANDTDADNDSLTLTSVTSPSVGGAIVTLSGGWVYYKHNGSVADSFTYTISDGQGATAIGTVSVSIKPADAQSRNALSITVDGAGAHIRADGIPGTTYTIQFKDQVGDPWQTLGTATADSAGTYKFDDAAGSGVRIYRSVFF